MAYDKIKYNNEYNKNSYDRITILLKKGEKEKIKEWCKVHNKSLNQMMIDLINEKMKEDQERSSD